MACNTWLEGWCLEICEGIVTGTNWLTILRMLRGTETPSEEDKLQAAAAQPACTEAVRERTPPHSSRALSQHRYKLETRRQALLFSSSREGSGEGFYHPIRNVLDKSELNIYRCSFRHPWAAAHHPYLGGGSCGWHQLPLPRVVTPAALSQGQTTQS